MTIALEDMRARSRATVVLVPQPFGCIPEMVCRLHEGVGRS